jgi:beta-glucosidase
MAILSRFAPGLPAFAQQTQPQHAADVSDCAAISDVEVGHKFSPDLAHAKSSDITLAFLGLSPELKGEEMPIRVDGFDGGDRTRIELPEVQQQLVTALAARGRKLVIVRMNGSALALEDAAPEGFRDSGSLVSRRRRGYSNCRHALGRQQSIWSPPPYLLRSNRAIAALRGLLHEQSDLPLFQRRTALCFGYGLSYTTFQYSNGKLSTIKLATGEPITVSVDVRNTGDRDGDETAEVYLIPKNVIGGPLLALVGFEKIRLPKGVSKTLQITIDSRQLSFVSAIGSRNVRQGDYELFVGGGPPADGGLFMPFHIDGSAAIAS